MHRSALRLRQVELPTPQASHAEREVSNRLIPGHRHRALRGLQPDPERILRIAAQSVHVVEDVRVGDYRIGGRIARVEGDSASSRPRAATLPARLAAQACSRPRR